MSNILRIFFRCFSLISHLNYSISYFPPVFVVFRSVVVIITVIIIIGFMNQQLMFRILTHTNNECNSFFFYGRGENETSR